MGPEPAGEGAAKPARKKRASKASKAAADAEGAVLPSSQLQPEVETAAEGSTSGAEPGKRKRGTAKKEAAGKQVMGVMWIFGDGRVGAGMWCSGGGRTTAVG